MSVELKIVMAQMNCLVGDIPGNTRKVIDAAVRAYHELQADVILCPELALTGYPPEDLLLRPSLCGRIEKALRQLLEEVPQAIYLVVGYPAVRPDEQGETHLYNMAGVIYRGQIVAEYAKQCLPNYQVFDEKRYFLAANSSCVVNIKGVPVGITICEDLWNGFPVRNAANAGARLLFNINASPFHMEKRTHRREMIARRSTQANVPIVYVNMVGGQDELVFDGASTVIDQRGELKMAAPPYVEGLFSVVVEYDPQRAQCEVHPGVIAPELSAEASLYQALVTGMRDYINKNGFRGVVLGLSGGIDSAVTLAVAVDALGKDRVEAVMMPFRYTAPMSIEDAAQQAAALGVEYRVISIEPMFEAFMAGLKDEFSGLAADVTEQNMQARCRGVLLMAISNKKGLLVLTTGNKSEMAVGYSTLYGDMAGGFDVLKDVTKMRVYALARYRNRISAVIPERVIERPPSAELAPDQKDEDNLPPYEVLDQILELYVEQDLSSDAIIARGFDSDTVKRVLRLIDLNEYKRRQAPVGVRTTQRGFGRDRRYPITSGWLMGE